MIVVFIHQNFPAQYRHLARAFADRPDHRVYFVTRPNDNQMRGVTKICYRPEPSARGCHPFTLEIDDAVRSGLAVAEALKALKRDGVRPDVIIGHNGWGETLFVKDVYPDVPLLAYFEFFYHARGVDVGFDPEFSSIFDDKARLRTRNAVNFLGFDAADWGHTATRWQRSLYPPEMRGRITAIHEGVDVDHIRPNRCAWLRLGRDGAALSRADEVVTYVSRNLEPYRGFHVFMRALPEIQRRRPKSHAIVIGGDGVSYGNPAAGTTYREKMLREVGDRLDLSRVHFLGQVPYDVYRNVLQVSSAHVYLTYPFVLSWSFLEAMASGGLMVGSATPPVLEVLRHRENGLAVDFFSPDAVADAVTEALAKPDEMLPLRRRARQTVVEGYDLARRALPAWERLLADVIAERRPGLAA